MRSSESDRDTFLSVKRKENKDENKDPETQVTKNEKSLVECLAQVIGATKKVPEPKVYEIHTTRKWDEFLAQFEKYCLAQYSDDKQYWLQVLEKYLEGEVKTMYLCFQGEGEKYDKLIKKLTRWVKGRVNQIEIDYIGAFHEAVMKEGETCYMYAGRLEDLAIKAYPGDKKTAHKQLRRKFLKTIPKGSLLEQIRYHDALNQRMTGEKMGWRDIRELTLLESENENQNMVSSANQCVTLPSAGCLLAASPVLTNTSTPVPNVAALQKKRRRKRNNNTNASSQPASPQNVLQPDPFKTQTTWPSNSQQTNVQSSQRINNMASTPANADMNQ